MQIEHLRRQNAELAAQVADLAMQVRQAKHEADLKGVKLRKANGWLADRINDVDRLSNAIVALTEENRNLREGLNVPATEVPPTKEPWDTLETSRDSLRAST